ncbi:MAG: metallophosphoesterase family protein [Planctomycetota bacterium]
MQIVHCSDLHICKPDTFSALKGKRFFGWLNWIINRCRTHSYDVLKSFLKKMTEDKPDIICITGDLSQLGTCEELLEAEKYLTELEKCAGRLLYIPGNHDKYIADKESEDVLGRIVSKYGNCSEQLVTRIENAEFILTDQAFNNKLFHFNGNLPSDTIAELKEVFNKSSETVTIAMGHFPLRDKEGIELKDNRKLFNAADLLQILTESDNCLYLCGHIHKPYKLDLSDKVKQLCAGSITSENSYYKINITDNRFSYSLERIS